MKNEKINSSSSNDQNVFNRKIFIKRGVISFVILLFLSLLIGLFLSLRYLESLRIVFGSVYVLFLPGFILSYVFFPFSKQVDDNENLEDDENKEIAIDWIERCAISFALSIAIAPLVVFYLSLIGVEISLLNLILEILGIIVISLIALKFRLNRLKGK